MTREEAIEIIKKEYACVDADCDIERSCGKCELMMPTKEPILQAYEMAIQALSQEPCDDTVSIRKDALKTRVGNIVAYNVEWLKKHWQMEMDIVCGVEPCTDAVSREDVLNGLRGCICDEWVKTLFATMVKQLPSVTHKSGWIPVSERLPEDEQEILFSTKTGRVHSGKYHDDDSANQWYSHRDKCRAWNNVVSAWMPLPKPYEPQESEE